MSYLWYFKIGFYTRFADSNLSILSTDIYYISNNLIFQNSPTKVISNRIQNANINTVQNGTKTG